MLHRLAAVLLFVSPLAAQGARPVTLQAPPPYHIASRIASQPMNDADGPRLEAALASNPEDLVSRGQLITFYSQNDRDAAWSNRARLLQWLFENHSEAPIAGHNYPDMPNPVFQQLKQIWISQVQRHPDNPKILHNAANFMDGSASASAQRVGGAVMAASLIHQVPPIYPPLARQARIQGTVRFDATIGEDGRVANLQLVSGHPLLVAAAQQAAEQWVYKPTLLNGQPVRVITNIDINFTLSDGPF